MIERCSVVPLRPVETPTIERQALAPGENSLGFCLQEDRSGESQRQMVRDLLAIGSVGIVGAIIRQPNPQHGNKRGKRL